MRISGHDAWWFGGTTRLIKAQSWLTASCESRASIYFSRVFVAILECGQRDRYLILKLELYCERLYRRGIRCERVNIVGVLYIK